jgi:hypothetical protein
MGRPIKSEFIGNPAASGRTSKAVVFTQAWLPGQAGLASGTVYIVKQTGTGRYRVTDGTNIGVVHLVAGMPANPGEASIVVTPFGGAPVEHAKTIYNRTVKTWEDHEYEWNANVAASVVGQADLPVA